MEALILDSPIHSAVYQTSAKDTENRTYSGVPNKCSLPIALIPPNDEVAGPNVSFIQIFHCIQAYIYFF